MKKILVSIATLLSPVAVFAQTNAPDQFHGVNSLIGEVMAIASQAVNFLMILATLYFIWTVIGLIRASDKDRAEKKEQLKWAIIGLAAMVCVWGIIRFAASTLGISTSGANMNNLNVPCPPGMIYDSQIGCH